MSIYGMLRTGVSGMSAQSSRLAAVSDNIANASTIGYKRAEVDFSTLVVAGSKTNYTSGGVDTSVQYNISRQGTLSFSSSTTDLAVSGDGFFLVADPVGNINMTRAGSFVPDAKGELVNSAGMTLMGYPADSVISGGLVNGTAGLEPIIIDRSGLKALPTTEGLLKVNLPSEADVNPTAPSANDPASTSHGRSSIVVYDDVGDEFTLDIHFARTAVGDSSTVPPTPDVWEVTVFNAEDRDSVSGGFPYANGAMNFPGTTLEFLAGNLDTSGGGSSFIEIDIPNGQTMRLDLTGSSQLAAKYSVVDVDANGSAPNKINDIEIAKDGMMYAVFADGGRNALYRIPLATVSSPDNLSQREGNVFALTQEAGELRIGPAETAGFGSIQEGALENSTVDLADELTTMIESQRNYTANSKVFQTGSELLDVLVNLKR